MLNFTPRYCLSKLTKLIKLVDMEIHIRKTNYSSVRNSETQKVLKAAFKEIVSFNKYNYCIMFDLLNKIYNETNIA